MHNLFQLQLEASISGYDVIFLKDNTPAIVLYESGAYLYVLKKDPTYIKPVDLQIGDLIAVEKWGELHPAKVISKPSNIMILPTDNIIARAGRKPSQERRVINRPTGELTFRVELLDRKEKMKVSKTARAGMPKLTIINKQQFKRMA